MKYPGNDICLGDLVFWYDPWKKNAGVGIVIRLKSTWTEILVDNERDTILTANLNINKFEDFNSLEEFINYHTSFRYKYD
jgi:hypothetical protein